MKGVQASPFHVTPYQEGIPGDRHAVDSPGDARAEGAPGVAVPNSDVADTDRTRMRELSAGAEAITDDRESSDHSIETISHPVPSGSVPARDVVHPHGIHELKGPADDQVSPVDGKGVDFSVDPAGKAEPIGPGCPRGAWIRLESDQREEEN